jgi:hypothetical protein
MCLKFFVMMSLQKDLDLLCEKSEKFMRRLSFHQSMRYRDFGLRERKRLVAMKDDAANAEVGATEVHCEIDALDHVNTHAFDRGNVRLATFSVPLGTAVT